MKQKQKEPRLGFGKGLRGHERTQKRGKKMAGEEGDVLEWRKKIIREELDEYRKILKDLHSGKICFDCILQSLISYSLAIIYDSMGGKRSKKMSKKWEEVEKECEKVAHHFVDLANSEDDPTVQFRGFDGF